MNLVASQKLRALEIAMQNFVPLELEPKHHFSHGTYTRELELPAGTYALGKVHRYSTTNILTKGRLLLITSDGVETEVRAPAVFVSNAGVQKAVYVLETTIMLNIHPWDGKMNLKELEAELIIPQERLQEIS